MPEPLTPALLQLIGNTPLIDLSGLKGVPAGVRVLAKAEFQNPGGLGQGLARSGTWSAPAWPRAGWPPAKPSSTPPAATPASRTR